MLAVEMVGRKAAEFPRLRPGRRLDITDNPQQSAFHSGSPLPGWWDEKTPAFSSSRMVGHEKTPAFSSSRVVRHKKPMRQHSSPGIRHAGPDCGLDKTGPAGLSASYSLFHYAWPKRSSSPSWPSVSPPPDILWGTDKGYCLPDSAGQVTERRMAYGDEATLTPCSSNRPQSTWWL